MTKRAIVLAGGGSRGAYQIGCWRAFIELGLDFQIITGTSVGALNGAMMVQKNYQLALDIWKEISVNDVLDIEIPDIDISQKAGKKVLFSLLAKEAWVNGGAGMKALDQTIQKAIHEEEFFSSPIDFALMTVKLPLFKPIAIFKKDISSAEMLKNYLLA
ncbi:MAG: patatin-like phospholipase family protein, partial [Clostridiales bacterium]